MTSLGILILLVLVVWILPKSLLVVPEGSIILVFALGKFERAFGPGIHFGWFDRSIRQKIPLKIGSIGTATSETTIEVSGQQVPVIFSDKANLGQPVRVNAFEGVTPVVTTTGVPNVRKVKCEKCGHNMEVRV